MTAKDPTETTSTAAPRRSGHRTGKRTVETEGRARPGPDAGSEAKAAATTAVARPAGTELSRTAAALSTTMQPALFCAAEARLGEGASWDGRGQALWWVDILGRRLMRSDAATGRLGHWDQPTEIGAALGAAGGGRVLVLRDRVEFFDPVFGRRRLFWQGPEPITNRFNDAGVDRSGNLWVSSMDFDALVPNGALWRLTPDGTATRVLSGYRVLNGPVFSPDGTRLYLCDTMAATVLVCDYDAARGTVSTPRPFVTLGASDGLADGMAMDRDGCLWLAQIMAGRVTQFSPSGAALRSIPFPVPMVTSCAFGGRDLSTLYVTSARILMSDADLAAAPASGSVFSVQTPVRGLPIPLFAAGAS